MKLVEGSRKGATDRAGVPLPADAPLITFAEAGAYLRLSAASVRKLVDGRRDAKDDRLGTILRSWVVRLSPHRRYIRRGEFMNWLHGTAGDGETRAG